MIKLNKDMVTFFFFFLEQNQRGIVCKVAYWKKYKLEFIGLLEIIIIMIIGRIFPFDNVGLLIDHT